MNHNPDPLTRNSPNEIESKARKDSHNTLDDNVYGAIASVIQNKSQRNGPLGAIHKYPRSKGKVARTQVHLYNSSEKIGHKSVFKNLQSNDSDNLSSNQKNYMGRRSTVSQIPMGFAERQDTQESKEEKEDNKEDIPVIVYEPEISKRSKVKNLKSSSFVNMRVPNLQEVRNKAKQEKLDKKRLKSQEKNDDISGDYSENNQVLKTKESRHEKESLSKIPSIHISKENRDINCKSAMEGLRSADRKSSISLLIKPYNPDSRGMAFNAFNESSKQEKLNKYGYFRIDQELNKTSKLTESGGTYLNPRSKSNANKNRHFQIRHESSNLTSMATFQKLMHDFPDIRCNTKENAGKEHLKERDKESIDRKASELKKYMSSGISYSQRVNL